ncbi:uncharacterized protein EI97DRAFT_456711 [Westerdykella ornata]|uniref:Rhodopsin domain-containing protein n=1 Tax=Westerdykella ornata TaxID=318751 RepID=A0A6A6JTG2_WESOR|nr:uncharacterized protein EI97DRAFT_456711 [Westerdykella ornata]KAF2278289.1 hypothetical protein EI97DRAFT_456711 [Westerdykella ornata]
MPAFPGHAGPQLPELLVPRQQLPPDQMLPMTEKAFEFASLHLIVSLVCQIIAVLVFCARVYTRACPIWRFSMDDYIICFAFSLMTVAFGLWYKCDLWAFSSEPPHLRHIDDVIYTSMLGAIAVPFWAWSTGLVKISIGIMLLRFQQQKPLRAVIYLMIALNVLLIVLVGLVQLFACIPYSALWDFKNRIKSKKCWTQELNWAMIYSSSVCNVLTDVVFSLMPLSFLYKIRRPLCEKATVGVLMALGLVASAFSLSKAIVNGRLMKSSDAGGSLILLGLLSSLEVQTSLIAACAPTLRSLARRFLQRMGLAHESRDSSPPAYAETVPDAKDRTSGIVELNPVHRKDSLFPASPASRSAMSSPYAEWDAEMAEQEHDLNEARYEQDPATGRIVCTTELKIHTSRTYLHDDYRQHEGWAMEDAWRSRIGVAR